MRGKVNFVWDIHYRCNFRCPFCWFNGRWDEMGRLNTAVSFSDMCGIWRRVNGLYGECHIMITGGEPSIYPRFIDLVDELSRIHTIKITSQLSGDMYTFSERINPERVVLDMNFHPLESKFEPFIRKVMALKEKGFSGGVCYLAYPPQMGEINYYREEFEKRGVGFALAAFWGEYRGKKYPEAYTEEETELIAPLIGGPERIKYHLEGRKTRGKLCRAGYSYASIKADGSVTRCGPLSRKPLGNFFKEGFKLFDEPAPCESDTCPCDEYVWLVKEEHENSNC